MKSNKFLEDLEKEFKKMLNAKGDPRPEVAAAISRILAELATICYNANFNKAYDKIEEVMELLEEETKTK